MAGSKVKVSLRNDSLAPIVIGSINLLPTTSVAIWDTKDSDAAIMANFQQVYENFPVVLDNLGTGDLVYVLGGVDQTASYATTAINTLVETYELFTATKLGMEGLLSSVAIPNQWGGVVFHGQYDYERLGPGAAGEVLVSRGAGAHPAWATPGTLLTFGARDLTTSTTPRFLYPGGVDGNTATASTIEQFYVAPYDLEVKGFAIGISWPSTDTDLVTYTLFKNGVATALTVTVAGTAASAVATGSVSFVAGDRIALGVTKAATVNPAILGVAALVEIVKVVP